MNKRYKRNKKLNNKFSREEERAREKWLSEECKEIEELEKVGRFDYHVQKGKKTHVVRRTLQKVVPMKFSEK